MKPIYKGSSKSKCNNKTANDFEVKEEALLSFSPVEGAIGGFLVVAAEGGKGTDVEDDKGGIPE
jgi:hypothetical protein